MIAICARRSIKQSATNWSSGTPSPSLTTNIRAKAVEVSKLSDPKLSNYRTSTVIVRFYSEKRTIGQEPNLLWTSIQKNWLNRVFLPDRVAQQRFWRLYAQRKHLFQNRRRLWKHPHSLREMQKYTRRIEPTLDLQTAIDYYRRHLSESWFWLCTIVYALQRQSRAFIGWKKQKKKQYDFHRKFRQNSTRNHFSIRNKAVCNSRIWRSSDQVEWCARLSMKILHENSAFLNVKFCQAPKSALHS